MSKSADAHIDQMNAIRLAYKARRLKAMEDIMWSAKGGLHLSEDEVKILLAVLKEWEGIVCLKDLSVSKAGLDWEEYENLTDRMKEFIE